MNIFLERMKSLLGDEFEEFLKFYSGENFRGIRVNTLKCSPEKLIALLDFPLEPTPFCPLGYYLPPEFQGLGNNPLHHAGAFYIQEPSAASAVTMLGVRPTDRVLDLCAAPGGKSTQIAAELNSQGLLWANEIIQSRALILLSNIERMGVRNAVVSSCHPATLCDSLRGYFDKILVDAPCSGEGMFRKNGEAQRQWSEEHVKSCAKRQLQILNCAKNALKKNGVMVYSTCTFSPEENEGVINEFLRENPDFILEDSGVSFGRPTLEYARRIFPMDGGEGHFAARMRKTSDADFAGDIKAPDVKIPPQALELYDRLFPGRALGNNFEEAKGRVYIVPERSPCTRGLSVLRRGVLLGEVRKNRFEPHHSAFMAARVEDCGSVIDLDVNSAQIKSFLRGQELAVPGELKGYTAVSVNGVTVGFGKASGGRLKNKYPKGLRIL